MKIEKIRANLAKAEKIYLRWNLAVKVFERYENTPLEKLPESVFQAYILTGTIADAAKALNAAGLHNVNKAFQSKDISKIITSENINDIELMETARFLLDAGRQYANKMFN